MATIYFHCFGQLSIEGLPVGLQHCELEGCDVALPLRVLFCKMFCKCISSVLAHNTRSVFSSSHIATVSTFTKVDSCEIFSSLLGTDHTRSFVQAARPVVMKRPPISWICKTYDAVSLWTGISYPKVSFHQLLLQGGACHLDHLHPWAGLSIH